MRLFFTGVALTQYYVHSETPYHWSTNSQIPQMQNSECILSFFSLMRCEHFLNHKSITTPKSHIEPRCGPLLHFIFSDLIVIIVIFWRREEKESEDIDPVS